MKDRLTKERRSWNMSRIRGKDTIPEKTVRSLLHRLGHRYRLHVRIPIIVGGTSSASPKPIKKSGTRVTRPSTARKTPRAVSAMSALAP